MPLTRTATAPQLPPGVQQEISRLLARLRRRQLQGSSEVARKTLEIMRMLVAQSAVKDVHTLIVVIKQAGAMMVAAQPHELVIGNMVRRVLATVREETADEGSKLRSGIEAGTGGGSGGSGGGGSIREGSGVGGGGGGGGGGGPSLMRLLDAPDAPDYSRQPAKGLKGPILEGINEVIEELSSVSAHIAEQAIEHIHANEVILTHGRDPTVEGEPCFRRIGACVLAAVYAQHLG